MIYSGYFSCFFKGENCQEHGILIKKRPSIPAPKRRITAVRIAGRDGELVLDDEIYDSIVIQVEFNFLAQKPELWGDIFRLAKNWLRGSGRLSFSDDPDWYFNCQYVQIDDTERTTKRLGNFVAEFHCEPYMHLLAGEDAVNPAETGWMLTNPFMTSHPVYTINGSGSGVLTVNGKEISFTSPGKLTIDTDRMMTFNAETGSSYGAAITGNYNNAYFLPGINRLQLTDGFSLSVIPAWRTL